MWPLFTRISTFCEMNNSDLIYKNSKIGKFHFPLARSEYENAIDRTSAAI
jgi:hypothetical protein